MNIEKGIIHCIAEDENVFRKFPQNKLFDLLLKKNCELWGYFDVFNSSK